jgi:hypothetical protein
MLYQAVLEALDDDHCGACQYALDHVERYFRAFFYEQVNDPWAREALVGARGWCPTHAWRKPGLHDTAGIAIVYEHLLREFLTAFSGAAAQVGGVAGRASWAWSSSSGELARDLARWQEPRRACPACALQWQAEDHFALTCVEALAFGEFRARYAESFGLCVPHLIRTLRQLGPSQTLDWLVACERGKMEHLAWELSELTRKRDYRYADEPRGRETGSWSRVIEKLTGAPGLVRRG